MTHLQRILNHLAQEPDLCDDCLSIRLAIQPRQTVNKLCSKAGSGVLRAKGNCAACRHHKLKNRLGPESVSNIETPNTQRVAQLPTRRYVREEDLRLRFNASLIETLGVASDDYYSRLDFDHLLRLKEGLARIHDIVTLKLTFTLVEQIAQRFALGTQARAAMLDKVNATHPNTSGFDVDWEAPNLIAEIKGCIPVNGGESFGAAQLRGLTNDVLQMMGRAAQGKTVEQLAKRTKINRPNRAEAIKLLGLYDSPSVRVAAGKWRQNLLRHPNWKTLAPATIKDLPATGTLNPSTIYLVYLKPNHS
jgi:hypothetical protein